ncbi:MAG: hypothetical protein DLM69_02200 [Candidatus Chloroheliales bacterium]|nr:MAG: hypothetical protein DLM69_02200 [Chloroflexota bacterium]
MGVVVFFEGDSQPSSSRQTRTLARALEQFLRRALSEKAEIKDLARCNIEVEDLEVRSCGSDASAVKDFATEFVRGRVGGKSFIMLLVDSDEYVPAIPDTGALNHIQRKFKSGGRSRLPAAVQPDQVHLMVQAMEAWFIADLDALEKYYGKRLKKLDDIVEIERTPRPKSRLKAAAQAIRQDYDEIEDGRELLARVRIRQLESRCPNFKRLLDKLWEVLCEPQYVGKLLHSIKVKDKLWGAYQCALAHCMMHPSQHSAMCRRVTRTT